MSQVIGMDIDGVITDITFGIIKQSFIKYGKKIDTITDYELTNSSLTEDEIKKLFTDISFYEDLPKIPFVDKFIKKLLNASYEVILLTQRSPNMRNVTISWLSEHNIEYSRIYFAKDKTKFPIDFFIEDNPRIIKQYVKLNIPGFIYKTDYNDRCIFENTFFISYLDYYHSEVSISKIRAYLEKG